MARYMGYELRIRGEKATAQTYNEMGVRFLSTLPKPVDRNKKTRDETEGFICLSTVTGALIPYPLG